MKKFKFNDQVIINGREIKGKIIEIIPEIKAEYLVKSKYTTYWCKEKDLKKLK